MTAGATLAVVAAFGPLRRRVQDRVDRRFAAADDERRRIERDLHDGAQQRLVSIGLALRHAQHALGSAEVEVSRTLGTCWWGAGRRTTRPSRRRGSRSMNEASSGAPSDAGSMRVRSA